MTDRRPALASTIAKAFSIAAARRGIRAYVPTYILACVGVGGLAAWALPRKFWYDENWEALAAIFGGILTFDGILLAVGWSAFAKIYEVISTPEYSSFLTRHKLMDLHMMFVELVHYSLAGSVIMSLAALITFIYRLPVWVDQTIFTFVVASSLYALVQALRASIMMNDLIWEVAHSQPEQEGPLRVIPKAAKVAGD